MTSKTALQLVSGSSVTVVDTVPLLIENSRGFFGRLGNPVTRALPSLLVPTSSWVLRRLWNPYLIVTLILALKMGLPELSFTVKSAPHEPRPASTTGTSGESAAMGLPHGMRTKNAQRNRMGRASQRRILTYFLRPKSTSVKARLQFSCSEGVYIWVYARRAGQMARVSSAKHIIPWDTQIVVRLHFSQNTEKVPRIIWFLWKAKERLSAMAIELAPSILSANFARLAEEAKAA